MKFKKYIIAIVIGSVVGIVTLIGQKYLPENLNFLANSASMWLIPAFLIPYFFKPDKINAILLSIISLELCCLGYYIFEAVLNHHTFEINRTVIFWLVCAVAGGIVFGLGANFSNTKENIIKNVSMNLLPAVFISEGLDKLIHISEYEHMVSGIILQIIIGLILYFVINNKECLNIKNILSILCLTILGTLAFSILFGV